MSAEEALLGSLAGPERPLTLLESAAVLGGLRFVELSAFVRLGSLARDGDLAPAAVVWSAEASLAHGRRASDLEVLLPVSAGLPSAAECTKSPDGEVTAFLGALEQVSDPFSDEGAACLEFLHRLLGRAYALRSSHGSPAADRAQRRVLERARQDVDRIADSFARARVSS